MQRALQVSQISKIIKDIIDHEFVLENVNVIGEISSFSVTRGTAYFVIKDSECMLNCVMFNCKQSFNIGDSVILNGSIKYYSKGGKLTLNCYSIELSGQGDLYKQFLILKEKLNAEGLFDSAKKKPIPSYIKRIGVVTSKTGAVIQDIINVTSRRNPGLDIVVYDAQVQGLLASSQIVEGINFFSNYDKIDCIILARGGGSVEDLQPFNEETVARAIYKCKKPIISAVGHETDFTITDLTADLRAPTPSAAAEIVAFDKFELNQTIKHFENKIKQNVLNHILESQMQLSETMNNIDYLMKLKFDDIKDYLTAKLISFKQTLNSNIENSIYRVKLALNTLDNLNPARVMAHGYSVVKKEGIYQKDYSNLKINDIITIENNKESCVCLIKDKKDKE